MLDFTGISVGVWTAFAARARELPLQNQPSHAVRLRLQFLMKFILTVLALGVLLLSGGVAAEKPNIIFILSDDLAQGDIGAYGQKLIHTPRIDRMAKEGVRFTKAFCGTSVCAPSRASLITGLHSGHCPIRGNWEIAKGEGQYPLPAETVTVAEILKSAGYATACMG
jgi:arylsulfatase A